MRSLIARLSLAGIVGMALVGCGSNGTSLSSGGLANGSGGGVAPGTGGVGTLPTCSEPVYFIDNGYAGNLGAVPPTPTYVAYNNSVVTETQGIGNPPANDPNTNFTGWGSTSVPPPPKCAPANETYNGTQYGFNDMFVDGSGTTQVIIKSTLAMPNMTYKFGYQGNAYFYNYTAIVFHIAWSEVASLTPPSSVSIELVGNGPNPGPAALAATYDVRSSCTIYPAGGIQYIPAWSTLVCPLNGGATGYGTNKNTQGPNAVIPGAAGTFTPIDPTMYIVFNYGKATNAGAQAEVDLTYMWAYQ
jgi:hypothetical protein